MNKVCADNNPYGKATVMYLVDNGSKDIFLTNKIYSKITELSTENMLNKKTLLPKAAHIVRHSYKDRGFATGTRQIILSNGS